VSTFADVNPFNDSPHPDPPFEDSIATARKAILARGILAEEQLVDAMAAYYDAAPLVDFPTFLFQRGLISRNQARDLGARVPAGETTQVLERKIGNVYSGYRVIRKLGQGGMGTVYIGIRGPSEEVVLKFLAPDKARRPTIRQRFIREAEVLRKVSGHPNVVAVDSVDGEHEDPHIVMEYVAGKSVADVLEERWSIEPMKATRCARDVALGLAEVHHSGIIHRDIKPANLLVSREGEVKIVDFGLAKDMEAEGITRPGQILGTPNYMAPEQWGDHEVDQRCDLFSLGATLYHMVVGEPPFQGKDRTEVAKRILRGEYTPPRRIVPDLPLDLELVICQLLMTDRRFRYPSADMAAKDLQRVLDREPVEVPRLEDPRSPGRRRYALLPGAKFVVGREESCDVVISHPSVSRQHAAIERDAAGFVLRDLGSTYGTYVGDMRVERVHLKPGDKLRFGKVPFAFQDGGILQRQLASASGAGVRPQPLAERPLAEPVVEALVDRMDRRTVVHQLEHLCPEPIVAEARRVLGFLYGPEAAGPAVADLDKHLAARRKRTCMRLFAMTREDLGDDADAWLGWWERSRADHPVQLVPERSDVAPRVLVTAGEPSTQSVTLAPGRAFAIGRSEQCHVVLSNRSVSRLHATVLRLHQRSVVRDQGSRFGLEVEGRRVRLAFLRPGDHLAVGKVEMTYEEDSPGPTRAGLNAYLVHPAVFDALLRLAHPGVTTALVSFLHEARRLDWVETEAAALFDDGEEKARAELAGKVRKAYERRAAKARELLPRLLGVEVADAEWAQVLAEHRSRDLPAQVIPLGWMRAYALSATRETRSAGVPIPD